VVFIGGFQSEYDNWKKYRMCHHAVIIAFSQLRRHQRRQTQLLITDDQGKREVITNNSVKQSWQQA